MNSNNEYALQTTKGQTSFDETTLIELRNLTNGKKLKPQVILARVPW